MAVRKYEVHTLYVRSNGRAGIEREGMTLRDGHVPASAQTWQGVRVEEVDVVDGGALALELALGLVRRTATTMRWDCRGRGRDGGGGNDEK